MLSNEEYLRFLKTQEKHLLEKIKNEPNYCNKEAIVLVRFEILKTERIIKDEEKAFQDYISTQLECYYNDNRNVAW